MKNSNVDLTFVMKYIQKDKNFKTKAIKKSNSDLSYMMKHISSLLARTARNTKGLGLRVSGLWFRVEG
jgi:hypothetical protein